MHHLVRTGVTLLSVVAGLAAQAPRERVVHLWVDPVNGRDGLFPYRPLSAYWMNPPGQALPPCSGQTWSSSPTSVTSKGQPLLHHPWPFKTIRTALSRIPTLPWVDPQTPDVVWAYAIVHLLPGVYAPYTTPHRDNGIPGNGERFPLHLPPRVSIQGTSALNTVFHLTPPGGAKSKPAFVFGENGSTGEATFIDSVAFYGATEPDLELPGDAAAITVSSVGVAAKPTIANCFFFRNHVGVMVAARHGSPLVHDGVALVNNTFAWNYVGVWNGELDQNGQVPAAAGGTVAGRSELLLLNNLFDSVQPAGGARPLPSTWDMTWQAQAGFEGIDAADLTVSSPFAGDYNAYEAARTRRYNRGTPLWPQLAPFVTRAVGAQPVPAASRDLGALHGDPSQGQGRGTLFVCDLLADGPFAPAGAPAWDASPSDFRLAPWVRDHDQPAPNRKNPLVDNGLGFVLSPPQPLLMANGLRMDRPPGFLPLAGASQGTWAFSSWLHDCEGFGNARVHQHPVYRNAGVVPPGTLAIDVGADELDQLVVAGYRFGTTSFLRVLAPPPGVSSMDNRYLWFLGPPGQAPVIQGFSAYRPSLRVPTHLAARKPVPTNYAFGIFGPAYGWYDAWSLAGSPGYYTPSRADVVPHLLPDPHPWWETPIDVPSNPIWQPCVWSHNPALYMNPLAGTVNPPGTYAKTSAQVRYEWIDELGSPQSPAVISTFGPQGANAPFWLRTYDAWGRCASRTRNIDVLPDTGDGTAVRAIWFSLECPATPWEFKPTGRNLQSFRAFIEP